MEQDMNRFPSNRLRVEFDGPDVSQEMLYTLFRVSRLLYILWLWLMISRMVEFLI
jgi:hypothetical protein